MRGSLLRALIALALTSTVAAVAAGWTVSDASLPGEQGSSEPGEAHEHGLLAEGSQASGHDHAHEHGTSSSEEEAARLDGHQPRHEHELAERDGQVPSRAEAGEMDDQFERFIVRGDDGLEEMREDGYLTGSGTLEDPYLIDGFRVTDELSISDTTKAIVIEESYIEGQLRLNYVGEHVHVHHNRIHDLRVNENVERAGQTTAGLFEHNEISFVGQLRHFAGTFRHNDVGPRPDGVVETYLSDTGPADLADDVVWNFDGYHLAHVHNNTVEGRVDVKLHGHFHGSCSACPPHAHHEEAGFPTEDPAEDRAPRSSHSYRYHTLDFENNTIHAPEASIALRLLDEDHAGDDRTAASEPNEYLEDRHEHHQYVRLHANTIHQGRVLFDIVNAEDDRHEGLVQQARIELTENGVTLDRPRRTASLVSAYQLHLAENASLLAKANAFAFEGTDSIAPEGYRWLVDGEPAETTGFLLGDVTASQVDVSRTRGHNATYGVTLADVHDTRLRLVDNDFSASEEDRHER